MKLTKWILTGVVAAGSCHNLMAGNFGAEYTTEWQTDFRQGVNWVNLLHLSYSSPTFLGMQLNAASVSIAQTREEAFMHDLQTFSNIEEENLPFALSMLGIGRETEKYSVFFGIRNVNEDYFTSPCTSLFTNSSCGIFPTLSAETPLANYPVASVGFDGKIRWNRWLFQLSVYNGTGYKQLTGKENVFRFCPKSDGIPGMTSLNYEYNGSNYFMGFALRSGMLEHHENGNQRPETETAEKECARIIWAYAEQRLSSHCSLLLQYSLRTGTPTGCRRYAGAGIVVQCGKTQGGIVLNRADFVNEKEWAAELTWKIPCLKRGYLQPALHLIRNDVSKGLAGLIRFGYRIA